MADIVVDGMTRVAWVPSIANIAAPTVAELNAGTLLQIMLIPTGLEGFEVATADVDNTSMASTWDTSLPGRQSMSGSGLVLKKQDTGDTVFTLLSVPNTNGFVVIRDGLAESTAWATSQGPLAVHPARTATHAMLGRGEKNALLRYRIPVKITGPSNVKAIAA